MYGREGGPALSPHPFLTASVWVDLAAGRRREASMGWTRVRKKLEKSSTSDHPEDLW